MKHYNKYIFFWLLLWIMPQVTASQAQQWSLLIYADPCTYINEAVMKNIFDLVQAYDSDQVTCYVQLRLFLEEDPQRSYAWRFVVNNNSLQLVDTVDMTDDYVQDVTDAVNWAFSQQPSQYYGIIFSGHGCGILEPTFDQDSESFELEYDPAECQNGCPMKRNLGRQKNHRHYTRSILMNDLNGNAMSNDDMIAIMQYTTDFLNQKLDILGFDLCLGACIEHAYQLAPFVNYFIGVQNCALIDGFDFYQLGLALEQDNCSPQDLANSIVQAFGNYYQNIAPQARYTLSAFDLSQYQDLHDNFENFMQYLLELIANYPELLDVLQMVRYQNFHACLVPMYTDLYQFIDQAQLQLSPYISGEEQASLQSLAQNCLDSLSNVICAFVAGENIPEIAGMNIYYPYSNIDSSYPATEFAQNSSWLQFLELTTEQEDEYDDDYDDFM